MAEVTTNIPRDTTVTRIAEDLETSDIQLERIATALEDMSFTSNIDAQEVEYNIESLGLVYQGRDLTDVFADEISDYSDVWAWLQARTKVADFTGLRIADYIPVTLSTGTEFNYCIGAFDPYYQLTDLALGHHIVMIPQTRFRCDGDYADGSGYVVWNTTNNNNGTADEPHPYLCSNLHMWELNDFYNQLPEEIRNVILDHRAYLVERYSSSGTLTDDTTNSWADLGPVWSLSEIEVYGHSVRQNNEYGSGMDVQFPYFYTASRRYLQGNGWWLRNPRSGSSTSACYVGYRGYATSSNATYSTARARPCFLIG